MKIHRISNSKKVNKLGQKLFDQPYNHSQIFETNSSEIAHYGKCSIFQYFNCFNCFKCFSFYYYLQNFHFGRRTERYTIILWRLEVFFLIPPNFLRSWALIRSAARGATGIYQFITSNHASFQLWWKENVLNH